MSLWPWGPRGLGRLSWALAPAPALAHGAFSTSGSEEQRTPPAAFPRRLAGLWRAPARFWVGQDAAYQLPAHFGNGLQFLGIFLDGVLLFWGREKSCLQPCEAVGESNSSHHSHLRAQKRRQCQNCPRLVTTAVKNRHNSPQREPQAPPAGYRQLLYLPPVLS